MKTTEQLYQELRDDPANASMTRLVNGKLVHLSDHERENVLRGWAESMLAQQIKTWQNVQAFMGEFTIQEKGVIALSMDPTIAALRLELTTWFSEVHSNDPRVLIGLAKLQELGIIDESRKNSILGIQ